MRIAFATLAVLAGCAERGLRPTFPEGAAGAPVIHEQLLLGFDSTGDAAVLELIDAEGEPAGLALLILDHAGGPSRVVLQAPAPVARQAAERARRDGAVLRPSAVDWEEGRARASALGFQPGQPVASDAGPRTAEVAGPSGPLSIVLSDGRDPPSAVVLLGEPRHETVELVRAPIAGSRMPSRLYVIGDVVWLEAGSVGEGQPLRRSVSLRRASAGRGAARLYEERGLAQRDSGNQGAARRSFALAIAADPDFGEALYHAAAAAARDGDEEEALALLGRAAKADPRRVQVLGRDDASFAVLRVRADVRALLGLRRLPPEGIPQAD